MNQKNKHKEFCECSQADLDRRVDDAETSAICRQRYLLAVRHHALFLCAQCVHDVTEQLRERAQHFRFDVRDVVEADPATCSDVTALSVTGPLRIYIYSYGRKCTQS